MIPVPHHQCPHCKKSFQLDADDPEGFVCQRLRHLIAHATNEAIGMRLNEIPDLPFADYSEECGDPMCPWGTVANKAIELVLIELPEVLDVAGDECAAAVTQWLRDRYPRSDRSPR